MRRRSRVESRHGSRPSTLTWPASERRRPCRHSTVVVLPAPFGPSSPKISPCSTSNETPSTTATPEYALVRPSTEMTAAISRAPYVRETPGTTGERPTVRGTISPRPAGLGGGGWKAGGHCNESSGRLFEQVRIDQRDRRAHRADDREHRPPGSRGFGGPRRPTRRLRRVCRRQRALHVLVAERGKGLCRRQRRGAFGEAGLALQQRAYRQREDR